MTAALAITLAVLPVWLAICVWRKDVALALFCGLLPAYLLRFKLPVPGAGFTIPSTLLEVLFLTLFAVWFFTDGMRPGAWNALERWAEPIALLLLGATLGVAVAPNLASALGLWRAYFIEPILFFPMFVDIVVRRKRGAEVLAALGASMAAIGATAVYQKFTGYGIPNPIWQAEATRRVTSVYGFPNAIGLFAGPIVVLMAGWAASRAGEKDARRKLFGLLPAAAAVLGALAILFAVSEGAIIGAAAGLVVLGLLVRRLRPWTLGLIIAACAVLIFYRPATDYASLLAGLRDDSGSVRRIVWKESLTMLSEQPVFGAGLAGYQTRLLPFHLAEHIEIFMYPHNLVLNFWSETGLIGLAGFLWLLARFAVVSWELLRKKAGGWIVAANAAALVAVVVHGLVDVPYLKNDLAFLFWVLIGLTESVRVLSSAKLEEAKRALHLPSSPWHS